MSNEEVDPNAPTAIQMRFKRVETAIRRKANCDFILMFDGICLLTDANEQAKQLMDLTRKLNEK